MNKEVSCWARFLPSLNHGLILMEKIGIIQKFVPGERIGWFITPCTSSGQQLGLWERGECAEGKFTPFTPHCGKKVPFSTRSYQFHLSSTDWNVTLPPLYFIP